MNFISIIGLFKGAILSHGKTHLGRWNIHSHRETVLKIKYATEDNCGFSYHNYKNITQTQKNNDLDYNNEYIYMMGYESIHD
jgi:hypothetical protein